MEVERRSSLCGGAGTAEAIKLRVQTEQPLADCDRRDPKHRNLTGDEEDSGSPVRG
jgi:hypothetical protein